MKNTVSQWGAVISAFLASLCCIGPLLIGLIGIGIGSAGAFTVYANPIALVATAALSDNRV